MGGYHFSGATQLLPANGSSKQEAKLAAQSLAAAVSGRLPDDASQLVRMSPATFAFREFRTPTKNLLCSLANALQQVMPEGWSLQDTKPGNPLRPRDIGCERLKLEQEELSLLKSSQASAQTLYFVWDPDALEARYDFYVNENFTRLVFSADEGTEVSSLKFIL